MAKFKCIHSGCVYEWKEQETIDTMRKHAEYVEIKEEEKPAPKKPAKE